MKVSQHCVIGQTGRGHSSFSSVAWLAPLMVMLVNKDYIEGHHDLLTMDTKWVELVTEVISTVKGDKMLGEKADKSYAKRY